jgi:hypothetical protein
MDKDLCRRIVGRVAPDEADVFDLFWTEFADEPNVPMDQAGAQDHRTGAGVDVMAQWITPVVIGVVANLLSHAIASSAGSVIRAIRARHPPLDEARVAQIAEIVLQEVSRSAAGEKDGAATSTERKDIPDANGAE